MSKDEWYVWDGVNQTGPYTRAQLSSFVDNKQITYDSMVRCEGFDWVKAGEVHDLLPMGWWDRQFANTSVASIVILSILLSCVVLPFGVIGVATCKHPKAVEQSQLMLMVSGGMTALGVVLGLINSF